MRNSAYPLCITTLVLAAFGVFFRWLQNQVSFDPATGLAMRGSPWPYVTVIWIVIAALILLVQSRRAVNRDRVRRPETFAQAFQPVGSFTGVLVLVCGLLMAVGGVLLFLTVPFSDRQRSLLQIVGAMSVVYGILFPFQMQDRGERPKSFTLVLCGFPIAIYALWIVVSYKSNIVNPTISAYAVEIITLCALAVAFYQTAGFAYDRPRPIRAIFWSLLAAFLCFLSVADRHYMAVHVLLIASGLMLMLQAWLIASNVKPMHEESA